jgi:hypothetical protein
MNNKKKLVLKKCIKYHRLLRTHFSFKIKMILKPFFNTSTELGRAKIDHLASIHILSNIYLVRLDKSLSQQLVTLMKVIG